MYIIYNIHSKTYTLYVDVIYTLMFISLQIVPVKKKSIHRGEVLARVAAESDLSVMQIVRRAGYKTRGSFYAHIKNPNLSFIILEKYAEIFNHDFSEDIPGMPKYLMEETAAPYAAKPKTLEEALDVIDQLKEKHFNLMEKYQASLEREKELNTYISDLEKKK